MRCLVQRVRNASVAVSNQITGEISFGLLLLVGFEESDNSLDLQWIAKKVCQLRIFDDEQGQMNCSIKEVGGSFLVVSQFTLHAQIKKGNRPSFIKAAKPDVAEPLYNEFINILKSNDEIEVATGIFKAMMQVAFTNDGPVTIWMDSKNKE